MRRFIVLFATLLVLVISVNPTLGQAAVATHYQLGRPIPRTGIVQPARGYPYGATGRDELLLHHGVDLLNPSGTWVIAAADGTVYFAGSDHDRVFGPSPDFYGNMVIVQHDFA